MREISRRCEQCKKDRGWVEWPHGHPKPTLCETCQSGELLTPRGAPAVILFKERVFEDLLGVDSKPCASRRELFERARREGTVPTGYEKPLKGRKVGTYA